MAEEERPLRILSVSAQFYPDLGGVETHVYEVTRRLVSEADFDITVFASDRSGRLPRAERGQGFDIVRRRAWPRTRDYYFAPGVMRVIAAGHWDLIHVQGIHTLVPVLAMISARATRTPYVVTFHTGGHSSPTRSSMRDMQWKALAPLLRGASKLIGVSRFERRLFEEITGIAPSRFTVIRNGGALPPVPPDLAPVRGRIVSSGRLEQYKGHHRVIEALPTVRATEPEGHLVILGAGPYEGELRRLAQSLGVADAVEIRHVPPGDRAGMARELVQASVMAALSDYEAHPVAVMEALTLGVPVVGFDIAGIADLVEDGTVTGLEPGSDVTSTAVALLGAMRPERVHARSVPLDLPTWETAAEQLASVYTEIGRSRSARRPTPRPAGNATNLRVIHVSTTLTTGGAERQVQMLTQKGRVESSVLCLYGSGLVGEELTASGVHVSVLGMAGLRKATAILRLAALLRRERPDVVHVHMLSSMLWGIPAARLARVPVVIATEHSIMENTLEGRQKTRGLQAIYLVLMALANRCIAVSSTTAERMLAWGVPPSKITIIDNGIDFDALTYSASARAAARNEAGIQETDQVVLGVGRLDPVKRFDVLLDSLAGWLREDGHKLLLLGEGELRGNLEARAHELGVRSSVHFLGARGDVAPWLSASDVLVSPSRDETFGMAIVEGMGNGLPVVFEQCPAITGLASTPAGVRTVGDALDRPSECEALAGAVLASLAEGRRTVAPPELLERYGVEAMIDRTEGAYLELLRASPR